VQAKTEGIFGGLFLVSLKPGRRGLALLFGVFINGPVCPTVAPLLTAVRGGLFDGVPVVWVEVNNLAGEGAALAINQPKDGGPWPNGAGCAQVKTAGKFQGFSLAKKPFQELAKVVLLITL
jgi:hypothetical protein